MSAFVVVHVDVKDPEKFKAYGGGAQPTVAAHGGEFILRGKVADVFHGVHSHNRRWSSSSPIRSLRRPGMTLRSIRP